MQQPPQRQVPGPVAKFIEAHGYKVSGSNIRMDAPAQRSCHFTDIVFEVAKTSDPPKELPQKYDDLVNFVNQAPKVQHLLLKPLLYAFFTNTVKHMINARIPEEALKFFETVMNSADGKSPFHNLHQTDLKKLHNEILAACRQKNEQRTGTRYAGFSASLTETTYDALVAFLMDRNYLFFLSILGKYVKVHFEPLARFSARPDLIPGFLYVGFEESSPAELSLLAGNQYDLAKLYDKSLQFEIFDDEGQRKDPMTDSQKRFPTVNVCQIESVAADLKNLKPLSKKQLPSCAYFTFQQENIAYDINGAGTLIAAATERGYVKLMATSSNFDLDDVAMSVPRAAIGVPSRTNDMGMMGRPEWRMTFCTKNLVGPKSYCVRFSPSSKYLLCGHATGFRIWMCDKGAGAYSQVQTLARLCPEKNAIVWCADWSPLGYHFATGCADNSAWLWCLNRNKPIRAFVNHQEPIADIKFHPNAMTIATASYDRSVMIWDVRCEGGNHPCTRTLAESIDAPTVVQFSRNGRILVSGDEAGRITTWDIGEGRKIGSVIPADSRSRVRDLSLSIEGTLLASASGNGDVLIWDMQTLTGSSASAAEPLRKFQPRSSYTHRLSFSNRNLLHAIGSLKTPTQ